MARTRWDECPVGSAKPPLCLWLPPTPTSIWRRLLDKPKRHCLKGRLIYLPAKGIRRAVAAALSSELSASPVHECVHNRTTRLIALFPLRNHRAERLDSPSTSPVRLQQNLASCFSLTLVTEEPNHWDFVPHKECFFSANDAVFFFKESFFGRALICRLTQDEECFKKWCCMIMFLLLLL